LYNDSELFSKDQIAIEIKSKEIFSNFRVFSLIDFRARRKGDCGAGGRSGLHFDI